MVVLGRCGVVVGPRRGFVILVVVVLIVVAASSALVVIDVIVVVNDNRHNVATISTSASYCCGFDGARHFEFV